MRGNPLLRSGLLAIALALTSLLVAAVVQSGPKPANQSAPEPALVSESARVPAYLTFTLSAPATALTLTEPGGQEVRVPIANTTGVEVETTLTLTDAVYRASLHVDWVDSTGPKFVQIEAEPDNLPTRTTIVTLHPNTTSLSLDFSPSSSAP